MGSHPGQEERILWFQIGQSDQRLYPTVYTLWHNPGLVPLLHTQGLVVEKLQGGADLMTPGLTRGPPFPEKATKDAIVAVASIEKPTVPAFVGVCEIDVSALEKVQGAKGRAVRGIHWEGDELWAWSHGATGGRHSPESIDAWDDPSNMAGLSKCVENMALDGDDADGQEEGGVSLDESTHQKGHPNETSAERSEHGEHEVEPSTQEIDQAFYNAFLYALYKARKNGSPSHYGLDLPINPSFLVSNLIQPYLPIRSPTQAQCYTIKKTSWKNTKKLIKHLDKQGLVKSKDRSGGETVIVAIDFDDQQILDFTPYRLPKPREENGGGGASNQTSNTSSTDPASNQILRLQTLIRPSPKLVPDLLPSKTAFYTLSEVSSSLRTYLDQNPSLTAQTSSPRFIKVNPFIANNILGSTGSSNPSSTQATDTKALACGEIARDILQRRLLEDSHLCRPYWILLRGQQKWSPDDASLPKPRSGVPPKLSIVIEKRTGTKTVTKVGNLEVFGIQPELLAGELQKTCASSTSVGQLVGGKVGQMEVLVQGDHREVVVREVRKKGVDGRWVEVVDKTKKGKGKKK